MPATARKLTIEQEDLDSRGGGSAYAALEVPADYEAILVDVEDYDKRPKGSYGWVFKYKIEGLDFQTYLAFSKAARWKLIDTLEAHGVDISEGNLDLDPNTLVGDVVGAHVDFPKEYYEARAEAERLGQDPDQVKGYREIRWVFDITGIDEAPVEVDTTVAEEPEAI